MEGDWIEYYCREKAFVKVIEMALKSGSDVKWKYYQGLGLVLRKKLLEGISCLEPLLSHSDFGLASAHLSLSAHQSCETVDRETISKLEWKIEEGVVAGEKALQFAALALMHIDQHEKACSYLEQLMQLNASSVPGLVVKGWLELAAGNVKTASRSFKAALSQDKSNLDATLGEISMVGTTDAIARLNQLIVRYPKVTAPLVEKARLQLSTRDWPQVLDTASRVLSLDPKSLPALELRALHHILVEGNYLEGALALRRYATELEVQEGDLVGAVQLFSRISGRETSLLVETSRMAEKAVEQQPHNTQALLALAAQHQMSMRLSEAARVFRLVTKLDGTSTTALTGLTTVQMAQTGITEQVKQQVEFLTEVVGSEPSAELLVLRSQCEANHSLLDKAVSQLRNAASVYTYGTKYLTVLNPDLMMEIAQLYPCNTEGLAKRISVLHQVTNACPGLVSALLALAQAYFSAGDYSAATHTVKQILTQIDSTNTDAHLIVAEIHLAQGEYDEANASLELGLSYNLQVRERPLYHVLLGAIQRHNGDTAASAQSMQTALTLNTGKHKLSISELSTLYLELVASLTASGRTDEASRVLIEANEALQGTEQEGRLTIARSELSVVRGEYSTALATLAIVQPDHPYYIQALKTMADIHLHKLNDGRAFAECYKQLVANKPSTENLILLGDAYMAIQEPELAVETYEKAMKSSSSDPKLSARLGRVLVRTHQYGKAIKCLRDAGPEGSLELAQLLMRLGQLEAAETTLTEVPLTQKAFVLAKIREKSGDLVGSMHVMKEARDHLGASELQQNAKMCAQLAEYASAAREYDTAITYYKRALQCRPADTQLEIALAKLYMQVNDWSGCQAVCSALLSRDLDNSPAQLMLADLAYRRVDLQEAASHFSALLSRHPCYWVALARLIEVKRRTAQLDDAKHYLMSATQLGSGQPGLSYCTGLFDWYCGNVNSALHHFNCARGDGEWGQQALHNMVELCLAADDNVTTATRLLGQMKPHTLEEESNLRLLQNLVLLSSKEKQDVELAMSDLTSLASQENLRVGATLGLATGYVLQKQVARARNVLKRVAKATWAVEEAEYLERCWLLLADLHTQAGKHEQATELLRRVLTHNQSCHRAHHLLGLIGEKEQKYRTCFVDASMHYRQAWKLSGENDPALGFKLAFNLVKAKRYADAISTCHAVLKLNPEYPRIRKEILDKAVSHLRS